VKEIAITLLFENIFLSILKTLIDFIANPFISPIGLKY
jgi:hypothetical protein